MYNAVTGRWLSPDPFGKTHGGPEVVYSHEDVADKMRAVLQPYVYARNNPANLVDPSGMRTITIEFAHYFTSGELQGQLLKDVQKEVERIFNNCLAHTCNVNAGHKIVYKWTNLADEKAYEAAVKDTGWVGGDPIVGGFEATRVFGLGLLFPPYGVWRACRLCPDGYKVGMRDDDRGPELGQTGATTFNLNMGFIKKKMGPGAKDMDPDDLAKVIALTIAHEVGLHVIGETNGHPFGAGHVDSTPGKTGGTFSPGLCHLLCRMFCLH